MQKTKRNIFRSQAVEHYIQSRERAVLPRFISPQVFIYLWIVLGLLFIAGGLAWFMEIPTYTTGTAVIVEQNEPTVSETEIALLAFFPPETLNQLTPGQPLFIQGANQSQQSSHPIVAIEPQVLSPKAIQAQFSVETGQIVQQPATVIVAALDRSLGALEPQTYLGSIYPVRVETGRYRLLSLLPGVGSWLEVKS